MRRNGTALFAGLLMVFSAAEPRAESLLRRTGESFDDQFASFDTSRWQKGNGWSNGAYMGCAWNARNLTLQDGRLVMSITDQPNARERYSCAEYRTHRSYGYGTYSVNLKAVRTDGVMTTVSHYTGPPFGDPWDEITFGIAGKDTTKLEIGYVVNGTGRRDVVVDLGFDAAIGFHTYGFEWKPDRITWLVDGHPVHTVQGGANDLPRVPGKIYLQLWNGAGASPWLKPFRYPGQPVTAEIAWVQYRENASTLNN